MSRSNFSSLVSSTAVSVTWNAESLIREDRRVGVPGRRGGRFHSDLWYGMLASWCRDRSMKKVWKDARADKTVRGSDVQNISLESWQQTGASTSLDCSAQGPHDLVKELEHSEQPG